MANAYDQLVALVNVPGALQVITNEHAHEGDCTSIEATLDQPAHFVCHNVTEIEEAGGGLYRAKTAEGDWTVGNAEDLLKRLQQAGA
jgi:hypothetical protein